MIRIVALHGFLGQPEDWQVVEGAIKQNRENIDFECINLNFGTVHKLKSPKDWAKKFNQLQKTKLGEKNILLGYSMGGRLALHAALDRPGLWDHVAIVAANPGILSDNERNERLQNDDYWAEQFSSLNWHDLLKSWNNQQVFQESFEPERDEKKYDREQLTHMIKDWSLAKHSIQEHKLKDIKHKLSWYVGEKDQKYKDLFEHLKGLDFIENIHVITKAGHRVLFDNPQELARKLVVDLNL